MSKTMENLATRVNRPDLDWSQLHETVLMLNLATAQIDNALRSGDESVNELANSFTSMVGFVEMITMAAEQIQESSLERNIILENCNAVSQKMHNVIIAFQFYDKLSQRLTHLSNSMADLGDLVMNPDKLYSPYAWRGLQQKIKSKYTVDADRAMFDAILGGMSVKDALKLRTKEEKELGAKGHDVELF